MANLNAASTNTLEKNIDHQAMAEQWEEKLRSPPALEKNTDKSTKTMIMPPPNVTGSLHIGHALTFTLQDIWARFWRMQGYKVVAQPGLDHAGIATQMMVENQLAAEGTSRQEIGRDAFLKRAFAYKNAVGHTIIDQLKSLGISANWDRLRFTLDEDIQQTVRDVFVQLYDEGLIYRSKKLVYWDTKLKTALSNLEVQTKEVHGKLWTLRYEAIDNPDQALFVATTRPETIFGDVAVAVHPEDERYQSWVGKQVRVPLSGHCVPVITDTHVEKDKGSGALKITPAHDFVDAEVGHTHHLEAITILDENGCLNEKTPPAYQGLSVAQARKKVLDDLKEKDLLVNETPTTQMVPTGDRSGTVLEPRLTEQWFLDAKPLAEKALAVLESGALDFVPAHYANTYRRWLENIEPWCLSRQLWWGHAIPAWYGPDNNVFVARNEDDAKQKAQAHYGKEGILRQDPDVLDTWFSSGLWPLVTLGWPQDSKTFETFYPTDTLVTGFDIIFFWVARMVMLGTHLTGKSPFQKVYIHGLVRDAERQKMSKTKGNVVNPLEVLKTYGVDPLRFVLALGARPGRDVAFSIQHVEFARNFLTKIWNAARFALNKGAVFLSPATLPSHPFNQWILAKLYDAQQKYMTAMKTYRFDEAAHDLHHFVWSVYCDVYIEMLKQLTSAQQAEDSLLKETKEVCGFVLGTCLQMLFPFTPFVTSELWGHLCAEKPPLHTLQFEPLVETTYNTKAINQVDHVLLWVKEIRRLRSTFNIPFSTNLQITLPEEVPTLAAHLTFLQQFLNIHLEFGQAKSPKGCFQGTVQGQLFMVPLRNVIDLQSEKVRLEKKQEKVMQHIKAFNDRLQNPAFIEKAAADRITETQENLKNAREELESLSHILRSLS